jgi:STE24 endopeptidase
LEKPHPIAEPALDPGRQRQAGEYARTRRYLTVADLALTGVPLALLVFSGLSGWLVGAFSLPLVAAAILYFIVLVVAYGLLAAPLNYYRSLVLGRRYGLSHQSCTSWLGDMAKAGSLAVVMGAGIVAAVYWSISLAPQLWWLIAWGFVVLVSLILSILAPVLIVPLFFKMKPMADTELKQRLEQLAGRAGVEVGGIYTVEFSSKGTTANAALMGVGRTRRIALSDTLLEQYSAAEIGVIMAHEMGHQRHHDIYRLFLLQSAVLLAGLYAASLIFKAAVIPLGFSGAGDVAALPLLILIFGAVSLLLSPLANSYSRRLETAADGYALELTGDPGSFVSAMTRLTDQNLAEAEPGRWVERLLHDHPGYSSRVEHARRYVAAGNED